MASNDPQTRENYLRLSSLLVEKGTEALRMCFDAIIPPPNLPAVLDGNKQLLQGLRPRQLDLLFPPPGKQTDSKKFDITLLCFLLRNICASLSPPALGWDTEPLATDCSKEADIARIELFKDEIACAVTSQMENAKFEKYWSKISESLYRLGIPAEAINYLKTSGLVPKVETPKDNTGGPESWKWTKNSIRHREKFIKLLEKGRNYPQDIKVINGVRVCFSKEFLVGEGNSKVYIGLGTDGFERAVKRLLREDFADSAKTEKDVLNTVNASQSTVIKYRFLDDCSDPEWLFLIMDLCEETLQEFVKHSSSDDWSTVARSIIQQILKGLADLHRDPEPILHRDLKPSNILRNVHGRWLLADFGISRILKKDELTHYSGPNAGTKDWRAVESISSTDESKKDELPKKRYKKESDIQVAGMLAFYIVTKGGHPFGEKNDREANLGKGEVVCIDKVEDPAAKDLISWMLSHDLKDRPSADSTLKHPYLQSEKQQFEMLCKVGNQREIKKPDGKSDVEQELNKLSPKIWSEQMDPKVLEYLCTDFVTGRKHPYGSSWTECLRLIRNVNEHWHNRPKRTPKLVEESLIGDPQEYFIKKFPYLPVKVHRIVRTSDWKERSDLQEYFM